MNPDLRKLRDLLVSVFHVGVIVSSLAIAFWVRFDFSLTDAEFRMLTAALMVAVPLKMLTFVFGGLHKGWWRYAGLTDLARIAVVNVGSTAVCGVAITVWLGPSFPRSIYIIDFLICFLLTAGGRYSVRLYNETLKSELSGGGKNILIYGAGAAGRTLLREIRTNPALGFQVIGFIDDNPSLRTTRIMDVPVLGAGRAIAPIVDGYRHHVTKIEEVLIAMPSATARQMREAHANCRAAGVVCRTIPSIGDLLSGKLSTQLRNLSVEDLLGREQIRLEEDRIKHSIEGRSLLITGAAVSIGSELCRQTACFFPRKLVLLDQAESELFKIEQELGRKHPQLTIFPIVADIRDIRSIDEIVRKHSIDSIYHAAAYKHVPMMEVHILEAVRNNVVGTLNLVKVAHKHRVPNFLMISSDKAVNPTSVMGVTKRVAELIVSAASNGDANSTNFVSVRFGNVLGSNGSVVPTFQAQIAAGGPVTVTHPDMRRYFMSIREAVQLVLQASTMGKGSNIFVLDMGEPIRIWDLAHNMIQLAGLVPGEDIDVKITGLRPGEKLFEEVALDGENMLPTYHEKIRIFKGTDTDSAVLSAWLDKLQLLIGQRDEEKILRHLSELVPEYTRQKLEEVLDSEVMRAAASGGTRQAVQARLAFRAGPESYT